MPSLSRDCSIKALIPGPKEPVEIDWGRTDFELLVDRLPQGKISRSDFGDVFEDVLSLNQKQWLSVGGIPKGRW